MKINNFLKVLILYLFLTQFHASAIDKSLFQEYDVENISVKVISSNAEKKEIELAPLLIKPKKAPPWNSIVIPSNCSGLDDKMWRYLIKEFIQKDVAVVLVDLFNPRGFSEVCTNQFRLSLQSRIKDVHSVLEVVRLDNRFNKDKIALGGHSVGAITTLHSSFSELHKILERSDKAVYNAFISLAPSCELTAKKPELLAPLLIVVGELDNWTNPTPCKKEVNRLTDASQNVNLKVIPNAYHTFSTSGTIYNPRLMKAPEGMPHLYFHKFSDKVGESTVETINGEITTIQKVYKQNSGFMGSKIFGANVGGDMDKAEEAASYASEFLKNLGW
jgi:dienelactone hydrolase